MKTDRTISNHVWHRVEPWRDEEAGDRAGLWRVPRCLGQRRRAGSGLQPSVRVRLGFTSDSITPFGRCRPDPGVDSPGPATYPGNLYLNELNQQQGTIQMWNVNNQLEFFGGTVVTVAYAGTSGRNIQSKGWNLNSAPTGPGFNTASRRPYPQYNTFNAILGRGTIDYDSLQLKGRSGSIRAAFSSWPTRSAKRSRTARARMSAWARAFATTCEPFAGADDGRSDTDVRHSFNLSYIAALPFGSGQPFMSNASPLAETLLGNWQVNGIIRARTGLPLAPSIASNQSGTALGNRPDMICSGELPEDQRTVTKWFDTSCFVAPAAGVFGNAPRTVFSGPGLANVDLSVFKTFPISHGARLQFRVEVFNLLNTVQFANPGMSAGAADFGLITSTISPARQMQFALKVEVRCSRPLLLRRRC